MLRVLSTCGLVLLLALPAWAGCPASPTPAFALPATAAALAAGRPVTIIAFGSSSTEGFAASSPAATYPARLEAHLRDALPGRPIAVVNRGKGGEDVSEMLPRLGRDVIEGARSDHVFGRERRVCAVDEADRPGPVDGHDDVANLDSRLISGRTRNHFGDAHLTAKRRIRIALSTTLVVAFSVLLIISLLRLRVRQPQPA